MNPDRKAALQALCRKVGARLASEVDSARVEVFRSGCSGIDVLAAGGFPRNTLSEVIEPAPSLGGTFLLHQLIGRIRQQRAYAALVDGGDRFDPGSAAPENLPHLYWVRCGETEQALRVTDLLAGDANFSLLLLDLRFSDLAMLRRVPGNRWYRLQRAVRKAACTCIAFTSEPVITSATLRLRLSEYFGLPALEQNRELLSERLAAETLGRGSTAIDFNRKRKTS